MFLSQGTAYVLLRNVMEFFTNFCGLSIYGNSNTIKWNLSMELFVLGQLNRNFEHKHCYRLDGVILAAAKYINHKACALVGQYRVDGK